MRLPGSPWGATEPPLGSGRATRPSGRGQFVTSPSAWLHGRRNHRRSPAARRAALQLQQLDRSCRAARRRAKP
jgi:hypothetical protein